jgi:hypothetical protein
MVEEQEAEKAVGTEGTLKGQWLMTSLKTSWCHGPRLFSTFLVPLTPLFSQNMWFHRPPSPLNLLIPRTLSVLNFLEQLTASQKFIFKENVN